MALITLFAALFASCILPYYKGELGEYNFLPVFALSWFLNSICIFFIVLLTAIHKAFIENTSGMICIIIIGLVFTICWCQIFLALNAYSSGNFSQNMEIN